MSEWKQCTVGDVCEVFDGPHATPPQSNDGPIYWAFPVFVPTVASIMKTVSAYHMKTIPNGQNE